MTTTDARGWITALIKAMREETSGSWPDPEYKDEVYSALEMAIKALKFYDKAEVVISQLRADRDRLLAEQSEDAVSREAVLDGIGGMFCEEWVKTLFKTMVKQLPSVNPQPCDDAISRILKRMWNCRGKHTTSIDKVKMEQIIRDELPSVTQKSGKWIPVSERLPEEREWYLAVFKEKDTDYQLIPRVADYIGKGENKWRLIDDDGFVSEYRDLLECVAWMPLPKPYEPQESENKESKE